MRNFIKKDDNKILFASTYESGNLNRILLNFTKLRLIKFYKENI
jgi:hypothetical protein